MSSVPLPDMFSADMFPTVKMNIDKISSMIRILDFISNHIVLSIVIKKTKKCTVMMKMTYLQLNLLIYI